MKSVPFRTLLALTAVVLSPVTAEADSPPEAPDPAETVGKLDVHPDLEASLFASEPMMKSPSNITVDHLGRVWVCEIVNYRPFANKDLPARAEGDRILILADTDGDGRADQSTVFYQGPEINSPHGICVLPAPDGRETRALVSAGDSVFVFTDEDGDGKADAKDVLFTGISGEQHDHGIHAFVFGPDGKLYFNFGNAGRQLKDRDGNPIIDRAGNKVVDNGNPYREGMVFRCNPDGSELETLAWNFRNNWEVCVDSFGTLWQSDNDDDGNRGVRINYVMEFGNYGYRDEMTGAGWRRPRTGIAEDIPTRHWHQNDPGVVPNLLQTGAGSPTGICVYEGTLLPEVFRNQILHCDAGPGVVRSYPVREDGAGYEVTETINLVEKGRDPWFRPSDVCVAPDGSLMIADWHDPGVGGHRAQALLQGRIFRVAPPNTAYRIPEFDFSTIEGAIEALENPNRVVRSMAWTALHDRGREAEPALRELFQSSRNPRHRARALWLLGKIDGRGRHCVQESVSDDNPDIRIVGIRLARQLDMDVIPVIRQLVDDPSPAVRRECAIALRGDESGEAADLWGRLALQHDGRDRWYLEALGIGARGRWERCFAEWRERIGDDWNTPAGRDIIWRSRAEAAMPLLAEIIADPETDSDERLRYFRAFDFHRPRSEEGRRLKREALIGLLDVKHPGGESIRLLALRHLAKDGHVPKSQSVATAVDRALETAKPAQFLELVENFAVTDRYPDVLAMAQESPESQIAVEAVRLLLQKGQQELLRRALDDDDLQTAVATATALGTSADGRAPELLWPVANAPERPLPLRRQAVRSLARVRKSAQRLMELESRNELDPSLKQAAAAGLHAAPWHDVRQRARELFPLPEAKNAEPLPPVGELVDRRGDSRRGRKLFFGEARCSQCHQVDGEGKEVGPNLTTIGTKLSRRAMLESVLFPSAGISHNYETYTAVLKSGNVLTGVLVSETPEAVTLKTEDALERHIKRSEIELLKKQETSLMPADLQKTMSPQDLVDVVEYLTTLKETARTVGSGGE